MNRTDAILHYVQAELDKAIKTYPSMSSAHEGWAVLREEVDELWDEVKKRPNARSIDKMQAEAIQVAAMAIRFVMDVCHFDVVFDGPDEWTEIGELPVIGKFEVQKGKDDIFSARFVDIPGATAYGFSAEEAKKKAKIFAERQAIRTLLDDLANVPGRFYAEEEENVKRKLELMGYDSQLVHDTTAPQKLKQAIIDYGEKYTPEQRADDMVARGVVNADGTLTSYEPELDWTAEKWSDEPTTNVRR